MLAIIATQSQALDTSTITMHVLETGMFSSMAVHVQAACTALTSLCSCVDPHQLQPHNEALLTSLLPNLAHQHSKVRAASLDALDALVAKVRGC